MTDLITKIESYDFKDHLGHPLVNCVEWDEVKEEIKKREGIVGVIYEIIKMIAPEEKAESKWHQRIEEMQQKQKERMNEAKKDV